MADVFRGPLVVGRRDPPPTTASTLFLTASLLVTTLAFAPLPIGAQSFPQQLQHELHQVSLNADTTRGTPKTLLLDAQRPVGAVSTLVPDRLHWLPDDSTNGIPENLRVLVAPVVVTAHFPPARYPWLLADTTQAQPVTLRALPPAPFVVQLDIEPLRYPWVLPDTSRGGQQLRPDAQAPVGSAASVVTPDQLRRLVDTSTGTPAVLRAVTPPAPFVPPLDVEQQRYPGLPDDTSAGTPVTLRPDAQAPVGIAQTYSPPDRVRPVVDTSTGVAGVLRPDAQAPVGTGQTYTPPDRIRAIAQVQPQSQLLTLLALQAPFIPTPHVYVLRYPWLPDDTSTSTAETLRPDAQVPTGTQQTYTPPDRIRPVIDTTVGVPNALRTFIPPPPFVPAPQFAPVWYAERPSEVVHLGIPKALIADAQAPIGANQTYTSPDRVRPVVDTSTGTAFVLRAVLPPFVPPMHFVPVWYAERPSEVVRLGTPKTITVEQPPVGKVQTYTPADRIRPVTDTSTGISFGLRTFVPAAPFTPGPHYAPIWYVARPSEVVHLGTPKALIADARPPIGMVQTYMLPTLVRNVVNTSLNVPTVLLVITPIQPLITQAMLDPNYVGTPVARRFIAAEPARSFRGREPQRKFTGKE